jgi:hypothetical protein
MTDTQAVIEEFIQKAARPVLIEPGEPEIPLEAGGYSVDLLPQGLQLHAWTEDRSYARRVVGIKSRKPGRLELRVSRLGRPEGVVTLLDTGDLRNLEVRRRGQREVFREQFRLILKRQFPEWELAELSTAPDLEHSLSPVYPRASLRRGTAVMAAIGAGPETADADGALSFGLIWLDYLRRRDPQAIIERLAIFLPEGRVRNTALRLRWLDPKAARIDLYVTTQQGEHLLDPRDWGNLHTQLDAPLPPRTLPDPRPEAQLEAIVRAQIDRLDAALRPEFIYRQAPAMAAQDRGIIDLLAVDFDGRLCVIELKASADIHLPLQALDYWMRVQWHLEQRDFPRRGYFPEVPLSPAAPLLYLVAPAFEFHPANETLLRFISPVVPVWCLGVGANWREELKVLTRKGPAPR